MTSLLWTLVHAAPCCAPRQWAAEVRLVTMDMTSQIRETRQSWHWVSFDLDRQQIGVINFDPNHGQFYQRELLDYTKGKRYMTTDEVDCTVSSLTGNMEQLCVPPRGGNITFDARMHFGVYPIETESTSGLRNLASVAQSLIYNTPDDAQAPEDGLGLDAETIYYQTEDVIGYVTVSSLTCCFINEMTYASTEDGRLEWQHTQWNNLTLSVDEYAFVMPKSCYNTSVSTPKTTVFPHAASQPGLMAKTLRPPSRGK